MKRVVQLVLLVVIVVLGYFLTNSILTPIRFTREYEKRKEVVVEKLKDIRTIEVAFKSIHGHYTNSFDSLIDFYKNGHLKVVRQIGSMDDSLAVAQGRVKRDTVAIPVKDSVFRSKQGFNIDEIGKVPFSDAKFNLQARVHVTLSQIQVPLFEASVANEVYLTGLDAQEIVNLNDKQKKMDKFPGLKVGDITNPNNNAGNWE